MSVPTVDDGKSKIAFSLGSASRRTVELQPKNEKVEKNFITGITKSGAILGGKEQVNEPRSIPLPETWVDMYKKRITKLPSLRSLTAEDDELDERPIEPMDVDNEEDDEDVQPIPITELKSADELEYERLMKLPPILRNRPPGLENIDDEVEKFKFDVSSRPDVPTINDYNNTPLENIGEALLRGMGWKPGQPVGLNNTDIVPIRTFVKRPERLGLGATPKEPEAKKRPKGWVPKQGESREPAPIMVLPKGPDGRVRHVRDIDEKLVPLKKPFYDGAPVMVKTGEHKGVKGTIVEKSPDGTSALIRLLNEEKLVIPILYLHQEDGDIAYVSEGEEDNPENEAKEQSNSSKSNSSNGNSKNGGKNNGNDSDSDDNKSSSSKKRKRDEKDDNTRKNKHSKKDDNDKSKNQKSSSSSKPAAAPPKTLWVRHSIHVKIRNKTMRGGAYYSKRAWIIDILPGGNCSLRLDGTGEILDDVRQDDLETIVPGEGGRVVVVAGGMKGELGKVIEKEADRDKVHVQMDTDLEIQTFSLDDVSELAR